jgi:hypothetical protein
MKTKYNYNDNVWVMHANKACIAPICEIRVKSKVEYYFYKDDFKEEDKNITSLSPFSISEDKIFATKEELLKSL